MKEEQGGRKAIKEWGPQMTRDNRQTTVYIIGRKLTIMADTPQHRSTDQAEIFLKRESWVIIFLHKGAQVKDLSSTDESSAKKRHRYFDCFFFSGIVFNCLQYGFELMHLLSHCFMFMTI